MFLSARTALTFAAMVISSVACTSSPNPVGTHKLGLQTTYDPAPPNVDTLKARPDFARTMAANVQTDIVVTDESNGIYKATFGACWVKMQRPKTAHDSWTVTEGSDCTASYATAHLDSGSISVEDDGTFGVFKVGGYTADKKTQVAWGGAAEPPRAK